MQREEVEEVIREGKAVKYIWHRGNLPANVPVQQVYLFAYSSDGLVMLVREKGSQRFTPVGGGVENGETVLEALSREALEEGQIVPDGPILLGALEVFNPSASELIQQHNLQVRYACKLPKLEKFIPLRDNETEERIFVYYRDLLHYVDYMRKYKTGATQFKDVCEHIDAKITTQWAD